MSTSIYFEELLLHHIYLLKIVLRGLSLGQCLVVVGIGLKNFSYLNKKKYNQVSTIIIIFILTNTNFIILFWPIVLKTHGRY